MILISVDTSYFKFWSQKIISKNKKTRIKTNTEPSYCVNILQKSAEKTGKVMTEAEIGSFLQGTLNLHLGTIDEKGEPNIQPVWFHHDVANQKIFFSTYADSKKMKNMQKNPIVYFSIDEDKFPYRCVKGKADVSISENISYNIPIVEKICLKQIGTLDDPFSKMIIDTAKNGESYVVEMTPRFYSTWDMSGDPTES